MVIFRRGCGSVALGILAWVLAAGLPGVAGVAEASNPGVPWPATDALGRSVPVGDQAGALRSDRFVGIFYFLLHGDWGRRGPYDVSKILAADPEALKNPASPLWGPPGFPHYWGQSLWGYYRADDPWVLRRHAQLLADAGVDTLIFDTTNAVTYRDSYLKLCEVFTQVRHDGGRTPQIAFMVNTQAGPTARKIYEDLYKPGLYPDLWFRWQGKPLLICDPAQADPDIKSFFTLRRAHWPFEMVNTAHAWHWEAAFPQPYGYTDDPAKPEQINVSVAQNLRASDGRVTNMSDGNARGRGFHDGQADHSAAALLRGANFQEQWERALGLAPPFVMVTGWNEWVAGRFDRAGRQTFVDQFNREYSRDIEPVQGTHGDNYYYQLVANVRRYKGAPPLPHASAPRTIRLDQDAAQWQDVGPDYAAPVTGIAPRDWAGTGPQQYTDHSGRNDLVSCKVARDAQNLYFLLRTRGPITPAADAAGLWLLLATGREGSPAWEGYDFIVNRTIENGAAWLERNTGGWRWEKVGQVSCRIAGDQMQLAIARTALQLGSGEALTLDFKWVDNLQHPGDIMDFYTSGAVAPAGRFRYRYVAP